jgi:hypothetical protein
MRQRRGMKNEIKNENKADDNENEMTIEEIQDEQDKELKKNYYYNDYNLFTFFYDFSYKLFKFTYKTISFILKVSGIYLLWIFLHYIASHLYVKFCVPNTVIGFFMSPFMTATPHCQGLRWIVYNAANMINNMWIILGAWICSTLLIINNNNTNDNRS